MIDYIFASGHVADLVLAVMACEAAILFVLTKRGIIALPFRTYGFGVVAGGFIVLGLRQALTGGTYALIAIALALSFLSHLGEVFSLVQRSNGNPNHTGPSYDKRSDSGTSSKKGL